MLSSSTTSWRRQTARSEFGAFKLWPLNPIVIGLSNAFQDCEENSNPDKREFFECTGFRDEADRRSRMQMDIEAPNTDEGENLHSQYVVQGVWLAIFLAIQCPFGNCCTYHRNVPEEFLNSFLPLFFKDREKHHFSLFSSKRGGIKLRFCSHFSYSKVCSSVHV